MILKLKFKGIGRFGIAYFQEPQKKNYFGDISTLFPHGTTEEEVLKEMEDKVDRIEFLGNSFDCEPMGTPLKQGETVEFITNGPIKDNGAIRHTMSYETLAHIYKHLEDFIADSVSSEVEENRDSLVAVNTMLHQRMRIAKHE